MKTFIKITIIVTLLFLTKSIYSQDSKFVELTVSDTITLHSTKIIYQINLGQQTGFMGIKFPQDTKNEGEEQIPSINDLTKLLDKDKFVYKVSYENDYSISSSPALPTTFVTLDNENDLKRLFNLLQSQKGISGKIEEISYESISNYYQEIYKNLYNKAKNQASLIANISGNTIGNLISVTDVRNQADPFTDLYKQALKNMSIGIFSDNHISSKKEEIKMIFRFALK